MSEHLLRMSSLSKSSSQHCFPKPHQRETYESCCTLDGRLAVPGDSHLVQIRAMTSLKKIPLVCYFALLVLLTGCQGLGGGSSAAPAPTPSPTSGSIQSINHIIFMMQENRSFDAYFGKINDYRASLNLGRD